MTLRRDPIRGRRGRRRSSTSQAVRLDRRAGRRPDLAVRPGETHALVGRNGAGKSTLVCILTGLQAPDAGPVRFGGEPAPRLADRDAWRRRVACVYQKSTIIPDADRRREPLPQPARPPAAAGSSAGGRCAAQAAELLRGLVGRRRRRPARPATSPSSSGSSSRSPGRCPSAPGSSSSTSRPPSSTPPPSSGCSTGSAPCSAQGVTFLFISHHLQEIYELCDTVTVFRDARHILTAPVAELARDDLVAAMTGEAASAWSPARPRRRRHRPRRWCSRSPRCAGRPRSTEVDRSSCAPARSSGSPGGGGSGKIEVAETVVGLRRRPGRHGHRRRPPVRGPAACRPRWPPASVSSRRTATGRAWCRAVDRRERHHDRARPARPARVSSGRRRRRPGGPAADRRPGHQDARTATSRSPRCPAATSRRSCMAAPWPATRGCWC